jgi:type VI secretion system protein ImpG
MEELLPFYERELAFLRGYSKEFAQRYPKIAARLAMSAENSEDPHVERMIQSFALLTARINKKLDDDYPEFTEALFEILYPHYLRAFPACSIAQFDGGAALAQMTKTATIARGANLNSRPIKDVPCRFKTCYDVTLGPVRISHAIFHSTLMAPASAVLPKRATASLSMTFETTCEQPIPFDQLLRAPLRVFVDAEPSLASAVMDAVFLRQAACFVEIERSGRWTKVETPLLHEVGFQETDALIDLPARSHPAYRLLSEYFAFPEKFNFIDVDVAAAARAAGASRSVTLHLILTHLRADSPTARLLEGVSQHNFRLGCTPIINLFQQKAEPIRLTHATASYPVVANARRAQAFEVHSIDAVKLVRETADGDAFVEFQPFYSLHHGEQPQREEHYWFARRDAQVAQLSPGYETEISVVDIDFDPSMPRTETLSLDLTCSNRDLPNTLAFGLSGGDLFMEGNTLTQTVRMLRRPTLTQRLPRGKATHWRLISHLSLSHVSLISSGLPAFKEMLRLYEWGRSAVAHRQIEAITGIEHGVVTHWLPGQPFATFVRGIEIRLTIDESGFVGSSLLAFSRVLDHFFGLYVHLNSFTQLVILSSRDKEELLRCQPRSGDSILL